MRKILLTLSLKFPRERLFTSASLIKNNDLLHYNIIIEVPIGSVCGLQEFLLSNHLSSYDPSSMQVNSQTTKIKINIVRLNIEIDI